MVAGKYDKAIAMRDAFGFDLTPPSRAQMQELTADLTAEERHLLLDHGEEAPFCGFPSTRNGKGCTPADCVGYRCLEPSLNLKAAQAGRASLRRSPKNISGAYKIRAMA